MYSKGLLLEEIQFLILLFFSFGYICKSSQVCAWMHMSIWGGGNKKGSCVCVNMCVSMFGYACAWICLPVCMWLCGCVCVYPYTIYSVDMCGCVWVCLLCGCAYVGGWVYRGMGLGGVNLTGLSPSLHILQCDMTMCSLTMCYL